MSSNSNRKTNTSLAVLIYSSLDIQAKKIITYHFIYSFLAMTTFMKKKSTH